MTIEQFFSERLGAVYLPLSSARIIPGMLLEMVWPTLWGHLAGTPPRPVREDGLAWDLLNRLDAPWDSTLSPANLVQSCIGGSYKLGANASLPAVGVTANADAGAEWKVNLEVTEIRSRAFDRSDAGYRLLELLLETREARRSLWDWVNDDLLTLETYLATGFGASMSSKSNVTARAAYEAGALKVDAGLTWEWVGDATITSAGVPAVPLAVRGVRV